MKLPFIDIPGEQTTAVTDLILAEVAAGCALSLLRMRRRDPWKATLWSAAFGTLTAAAALGAVAHGFKMSPEMNAVFWKPLNLALGTTIALFVVGTVYDTWGKRAAQRSLPVALTAAGGFFAYMLARPGTFLPFVIYQSGGMLFALGAYSWLALVRQQRGAALLAAGIVTTMVAAGIQTNTKVSLTLIWYFDQNGVYHLVQMPGLCLLYAGVRASLLEPAADGVL